MGAVPVAIRRATLADLDVLAPLFDEYRGFYKQSSDLSAARAFLAARLEGGQSVIFIAELDGVTAGFTQLFPSYTSIGMRRAYILNDLFVAPAARCRGVARRLLETAVTFARGEGAARLTLSTAVDNQTAQALYRAAGWKQDEAFLVFNMALD